MSSSGRPEWQDGRDPAGRRRTEKEPSKAWCDSRAGENLLPLGKDGSPLKAWTVWLKDRIIEVERFSPETNEREES
jgi:hypothetical protein